jgi:hypothetical protein
VRVCECGVDWLHESEPAWHCLADRQVSPIPHGGL